MQGDKNISKMKYFHDLFNWALSRNRLSNKVLYDSNVIWNYTRG